jgi:penicillin amidase
LKTRIALVGLAVALAIVLAISALSRINTYRRDGEVSVRGLEEAVVVYRDEYGVPYVYASNLRDLIRGQGFVMAQDRLFILELFRALSEGRQAELVGEAGGPRCAQSSVSSPRGSTPSCSTSSASTLSSSGF